MRTLNRVMIWSLSALFSSFLMVPLIQAQEKPVTYWLVWHQPPNYFQEGEFQGEGIADQLLKDIQTSLTGYEHKNLKVNAGRYEKEIRRTDRLVCTAWAWKQAGNEEFRVFTKPNSLIPPIGIYTLDSRKDVFGEPGNIVSLENLLKNDNLRLGYLKGFPFSQRVGDLIEKHKSNTLSTGVGAVRIHFDTLTKSRYDYVLGIHGQIQTLRRTENLAGGFQFYNIKEEPDHIKMYSHCTMSDDGKEVVRNINQLLTKDYLKNYLEFIESWYGESERYNSLFRESIIEGKSHPNVVERS